MAYNYWCPNRKKDESCDFCNSKGDIQSEDKLRGATCYVDGNTKLKLMGETSTMGINVGKFKKGRGAEGKKRASDHFKKEIYPTLSRRDKLHFKRKYKGKI